MRIINLKLNRATTASYRLIEINYSKLQHTTICSLKHRLRQQKEEEENILPKKAQLFSFCRCTRSSPTHSFVKYQR